jgi:hypothetical protein
MTRSIRCAGVGCAIVLSLLFSLYLRFPPGTIREIVIKGGRGKYSMDRLKNKVALISGGGRGMGAAETRLFIAERARVIVGDVLDDQAKELAAGINAKAGARVIAGVHLMSAAPPTGVRRWKRAKREFDGLDILESIGLSRGLLAARSIS